MPASIALNLDRVLEIEPEFLDEIPEHEHDAEISSLALTTDQPMEPEKFIRWIQDSLSASAWISCA